MGGAPPPPPGLASRGPKMCQKMALFWGIFGGQNDPQITPKTALRRAPKGQKRGQKRGQNDPFLGPFLGAFYGPQEGVRLGSPGTPTGQPWHSARGIHNPRRGLCRGREGVAGAPSTTSEVVKIRPWRIYNNEDPQTGTALRDNLLIKTNPPNDHQHHVIESINVNHQTIIQSSMTSFNQ